MEVPRPEIASDGRLRVIDFPEPFTAPTISEMPLEVRTYQETTALRIPNRTGKKNIGAAYEANGRLIAETQRAKAQMNWFPSPKRLPNGVRAASRLPGRTYFAGRYVTHFGHLLLETLTRFWPERDYSEYDHFLVTPKFIDTSWKGQLGDSFKRMLAVAEIPSDRMTVAVDPVACEQLDVPTSPFTVGVTADPRFLAVYDRIAARLLREQPPADDAELPRRIYLSRSKLDKRRQAGQRIADNEPEVEALFSAQGFAIVHPQTLPFAEQVALLRSADVVAGCDGSALHLVMFSRPGARLLSLDSRNVANQFLIDQARGIDAVHLWAATEASSHNVKEWTIDVPRVGSALELTLDGSGTA